MKYIDHIFDFLILIAIAVLLLIVCYQQFFTDTAPDNFTYFIIIINMIFYTHKNPKR